MQPSRMEFLPTAGVARNYRLDGSPVVLEIPALERHVSFSHAEFFFAHVSSPDTVAEVLDPHARIGANHPNATICCSKCPRRSTLPKSAELKQRIQHRTSQPAIWQSQQGTEQVDPKPRASPDAPNLKLEPLSPRTLPLALTGVMNIVVS